MYGELTIPARFNGPPTSGNGGYSAGALAEAMLDGSDGAVQITLRQPPPLDAPMLLTEDRTACVHQGATVLEGTLIDEDLEHVEPVSYDEAVDAMTRYLGLQNHPFPTCFACGPNRTDGLGIFPGRIDERRVASAWTPDPSLTGTGELGIPVTWAALDCIGGWSSDIDQRPMVLGRMACTVDAAPRVGEPHVVVGRWLGSEGRKTYTLSTLYDSDGRIVARASHVWIAVDPSTFS
jgi:hypothetical protein